MSAMKRRFRVGLLFFGVQLLCAVTLCGQGPYKIGTAPLPTSSDLPQALTSVLQAQGQRLLDAKGVTQCEIWLRKSAPAQPAPASSGDVLYGALSMGEFVGVLHFPGAGSDFRGQAIKAGYYTLRYVLIPQDGNHMGVSPNRDFILLSPIAADSDPAKVPSFNDLLKLSKQASGTNHPAVISLAPVHDQSFPSVAQDDQGHWIMQVKLPTSSGELPIAVILVGQAQS